MILLSLEHSTGKSVWRLAAENRYRYWGRGGKDAVCLHNTHRFGGLFTSLRKYFQLEPGRTRNCKKAQP